MVRDKICTLYRQYAQLKYMIFRPSNADEPNRPFPTVGTQNQGKNVHSIKPKSKTGTATLIHPKTGLFYLITLAAFIIPTMF